MNNNITTVYFDINGVLLDFDKSMEVYAGISRENIFELQTEQAFRLGESPVDTIIAKYLQEGIISKAPEMPEFSIFAEMISWLEKNNINVEFLSSVNNMFNADIIKTHKKQWLHNKNLVNKQNFVNSLEDKKDYADNNTLLIDDSEKSVNLFSQKGQAIYHNDIEQTIKQFKKFFPAFKIIENKFIYQKLTHQSVLKNIIEEY